MKHRAHFQIFRLNKVFDLKIKFPVELRVYLLHSQNLESHKRTKHRLLPLCSYILRTSLCYEIIIEAMKENDVFSTPVMISSANRKFDIRGLNMHVVIFHTTDPLLLGEEVTKIFEHHSNVTTFVP